jgi:hypothetical protein
MGFEDEIQQWVLVDNKMKILNEQIKQLRDRKNSLEQGIINYASSHNLSNSAIEISDGKLKFTNTKVTQPLTFTYVEKTLGEIIHDEVKVKQIIAHLKQKRESKIVPEIKRVSKN